MKRVFPAIGLIILGFVLASAPAHTAEEVIVVAGLRIVPDPEFMSENGSRGATIRTSEVIDRILKNPRGEDLGQVDDLVLGKDGRVAYLVIAGGEQLIPVPFKSVRFGGYENWLFLSNMEKSRFEHAPSIGRDQWSRLEDPVFEKEVFSYYGAQTDRPERRP